MLNKIVLNTFGETLLPYPGCEDNDPNKSEPESAIGVHEMCDGWVDILEVSANYQAIICRQCNLRILVPKEINTWKSLERWATN